MFDMPEVVAVPALAKRVAIKSARDRKKEKKVSERANNN